MMICGTLITPDITLLTRRRTALKRISDRSAADGNKRVAGY